MKMYRSTNVTSRSTEDLGSDVPFQSTCSAGNWALVPKPCAGASTASLLADLECRIGKSLLVASSFSCDPRSGLGRLFGGFAFRLDFGLPSFLLCSSFLRHPRNDCTTQGPNSICLNFKLYH